MAKRPANKKLVPAKALAPSPILMTTKALENRKDRKKDKAYQKSLKKMGATGNGGGRANVPAAKEGGMVKCGASNPPAQKGTPNK